MADLTRDLDTLLRTLPAVRNTVAAVAVAGRPEQLQATIDAAIDQVGAELLCCELYSAATQLVGEVAAVTGDPTRPGFLRSEVLGPVSQWPQGATALDRLTAGLEADALLSDVYPAGTGHDGRIEAFAMAVVIAGMVAFWARIEAYERSIDVTEGPDFDPDDVDSWLDLHRHGSAPLLDALNGTGSTDPDAWMRHMFFGRLMREEVVAWFGTGDSIDVCAHLAQSAADH